MTAEPARSFDDARYPSAARPAPDVQGSRGAGRGTVRTPERSTPPRQRSMPSEVRPRQRTVTRAGRSGRSPSAPPVPVAAPRAPFVALLLGLVVAGIVGLLVLNTAINTRSLTVQQLRDKQATLDAREQQLNRELADRGSPGNLQAAATRMGLVPAGTTAFIRLPDGKVIGVPQPAPAHPAAR